jgi:AcrR family transcriptional regulator
MSQGWESRQLRTRTEILHAVGEIIAADGLDGLTMRKLADRAGVAVATLYNQFTDRDGVLVAFVSNGLDQLEFELDEHPAAAPIDATRVLFAALDETIDARRDVWQPVIATLKSLPDSPRMGAVGERIVAAIEADLAKAQADTLLVAQCNVDRLAWHIFVSWMRGLERWAHGTIDWDLYRSSSQTAREVALASVLIEPMRSDALHRAGILGSLDTA